MKKKRWLIILGFIALCLIVWILFNPFGRFGWCRFGCLTYNCLPRPLSDLQVRCDGKTRKVDKTHSLKLEDVKWLMEPRPEILIIGTGWDGVVKPGEEIKQIQDCEVRILKTGEAVEEFNELKREKKKAAIHVHSTC